MDEERATVEEDLPPASPAESLRLIHEQRAHAERSLTPDPRLIYWPWATAWLLGFGAIFLRYGEDGTGLVAMPEWVPLAILFALMVVAMAIMIGGLFRAGRQVAGESATKGTLYGLSWGMGFAGLSVTAGHLSDFLPPPQVGLMWAALSIGLVSVLYIAGAAIYPAPTMLHFGLWLGALNIVGVIAGPGWHSLIIALAGGGGGYVFGFIAWRQLAGTRAGAGRGR